MTTYHGHAPRGMVLLHTHLLGLPMWVPLFFNLWLMFFLSPLTFVNGTLCHGIPTGVFGEEEFGWEQLKALPSPPPSPARPSLPSPAAWAHL